MTALPLLVRRWCRLLLAAASITVLGAVAAPAGQAAYTGHRLYAVATGMTSGSLVPFDVAANGAFVERDDQAVSVPGETSGLLVDREARSVFVSSRETYDFSHGFTLIPGVIDVFTVGANGALTLAQSQPSSTFAMTLSADGSRLFAQQVTGEIDSYAIQADGTLGPQSTQYAFTQPANTLSVSPDNQTLYMNGQNALGFQWTIGPGASLTSLGSGLFGLPCQALFMGAAVSSANFDVQCFNGNGYTFSVGADGALTANGPAFAGSNGEYGNSEDARGRAFYTGSGAFSIEQLRRQANGRLAPYATPSVASPGQTQAIAADPDGTTLAVATGSNGLERYAIAADGSLSAAPTASTPLVMRPPNFLAYSPQQGPRAALGASQTTEGATVLDAGSSQAFDGYGVARYDWAFGDGTSLADGGPTVSHTYPQPGTYTATVTVTDAAGCSVSGTYNGSMALCAGSPGASAGQDVQVASPAAPASATNATGTTSSAARLASPAPLTATPGDHGRSVLLSWRRPADAQDSTRYLIAWSTTHSASGPGDRLAHHLHWTTQPHILMRGARPGTTFHYAVYAYGADGLLSRGAKVTVRIG